MAQTMWLYVWLVGPIIRHHSFSVALSLTDHLKPILWYLLVYTSAFVSLYLVLYMVWWNLQLNSQIITFEHEGNWGKALEYYDLLARSDVLKQEDSSVFSFPSDCTKAADSSSISTNVDRIRQSKPYKGLIRSLQQIGCTHVLDLYCQGLTSRNDQFQHDLEFAELQYEAAWRAGNWDFSLPYTGDNSTPLTQNVKSDHFNYNMHR